MKNKKSQHKAGPTKLHLHSTSLSAQRQRLLKVLKTLGAVNTIFARERLNIMMPAARIKELRMQGHEIFTTRITLKDQNGFVHSGIARYVLIKLVGSNND